MAVLEAMALGKPCVITKETNMGNIVSSYNAGLVGYANSEEIAELLLEVCGMPEDALLKMGQNGKRWVTENLSWSKVADQYLQMYNDYYAGI